jgi:acyl carrier protein
MSTFEQLRETMAVTLNVAPDTIRATTAQHDIGSWDSLGHINLMIAIEDTFDVTFEPEDFATLTSVPVILAYLNGHGVR